MSTTPTTPTATDPDTLTPLEIASMRRYLSSKAGPIRSVTMRYRSRPSHRFNTLDFDRTIPTACWTAIPAKSRRDGPYTVHQITLGFDSPKSWTPKTKASPRRRLSALKDLLTHEAAHAAYTDCDLPAQLATCKRLRIPFRLLNLHEDIRIESAWTAATGKEWEWHRHYDTPLPDSPAALLLEMGQTKNPSTAYDSTKIKPADATWIAEHYRRTADPAQTPNTRAAILRSVEFARRFPETALPPPPRGEGVPTDADGTPEGDMIAEPHPDAEKELTDGGGSENGTGTPKETRTRDKNTSDSQEVIRRLGHGALPFARAAGYPLADLATVPTLTQTLADLTRRLDRQPVRLATTGSRLHLPAIAAGNEAAFRRNSPAKGPAEITLIFDMSGSMSDVWTSDGAAFLAAMMQLARQGAFTLHAWLSNNRAALKLPHTTIPDDIGHLAASGGAEALARTMRHAAADRKRSRITFVYTDGQITDGRTTDTRSAFGLLTCREAARMDYYAECMRDHFDRFRIAETAAQLAREAVRLALA